MTIFIINAILSCATFHLSDLNPVYETNIYSRLAPSGEFSDPYLHERIVSRSEHEYRISFGIGDSNNMFQPMSGANWLSLFLVPDTSNRQFDRNALAAVARMGPGDEVDVPVRHVVQVGRRTEVVDNTFRVRHLGCRTRDVRGESIEVHAYELHTETVSAQGGAIRTNSEVFVREIAPAYGWWVASVSNAGTLVLVDVAD